MFLKEFTVSAGLALLALFNIVFWHNFFGGWAILLYFCWYFGRGAQMFLRKYFGLSAAWRIFLLSMFLVLAVLGCVTGAVSLISRMSSYSLAVSFLITGLIFGYFKSQVGELDEPEAEIDDLQKQVLEEVPNNKAGVFLYLILVVVGFYFLQSAHSTNILLTPWQIISTNFIWIFFAATLVLGLLIFARIKSSVLLFLLIIHSYLLHFYLPATSSLFWGADGWRHLASQASWWQNGSIIAPGLNVAPLNFWQQLDFGTLAYAQFNSLSLIFQKLCMVGEIPFIHNFLPFIWPVIFSIVIFEIARVLGAEKKAALFVVWLSMWPYALQVSGSFSLPVNLGILFWLTAVLLQIKNTENFSKIGTAFLFVLGVLSIFIHSVFFILFWVSFGLLFLFKKYRSVWGALAMMVLTAGIFPILELVSKYSQINHQLNWWAQIKAIAGSFSGWYTAFGLRTNNINVGNTFFNQPATGALVINDFTQWRGWIILVMMIFWCSWILCAKKILQTKNYLNIFWLVLTSGIFGSYIISRYFLSGENIFARRLDATLACLFILPVGIWLYGLIENKFSNSRLVIFAVVVIFSMATIGSYTMGPDSRAVTEGEYGAMSFVWSQVKKDEKKCVLADTYPLLALEQISYRKIVGGGFPIGALFGQKEREQLLNLAKTDPINALLQSKQLLGTDSCYLVGDYDMLNSVINFGGVKVFKF